MHMKRKRALSLAGIVVPLVIALVGGLVGCGGGNSGGVVPPPNGLAWWGFGRDAQHSALGGIATQPLVRIQWSTPVDLAPRSEAGVALFIHYGSPVITSQNTLVVPVKTGVTDGFKFEARSGYSGALVWSATSDYILPAHNWTPSYNLALTLGNRVYAPGAGGKLIYRDDVDSATGATQTAVFYGSSAYAASPAIYDSSIFINTPLTTDTQGNVFFGFIATGTNPAGLAGGIARIAPDGTGTWIGAAAASGDMSVSKVVMNSAPALSPDLQTLYVAVNNSLGEAVARQTGYLLALDSTTLALKSKIALNDPKTGVAATLNDNGTSSPSVGPDGDVFFGVLESNRPAHNLRGYLLHFDATLSQTKTPGSFGWDTTASILPASMLPSYTGSSTYLLVTKYNNYGGAGTGDGKHRMALLDPNQGQADMISGIPVMQEILTILGVTADPDYPGGVAEWCINSAAVDPLTRSVLMNSEDGFLYRWDLSTNTFSERLPLDGGLGGSSYTPTAIGPDGRVYAINNASLFSVGR